METVICSAATHCSTFSAFTAQNLSSGILPNGIERGIGEQRQFRVSFILGMQTGTLLAQEGIGLRRVGDPAGGEYHDCHID